MYMFDFSSDPISILTVAEDLNSFLQDNMYPRAKVYKDLESLNFINGRFFVTAPFFMAVSFRQCLERISKLLKYLLKLFFKFFLTIFVEIFLWNIFLLVFLNFFIHFFKCEIYLKLAN